MGGLGRGGTYLSVLRISEPGHSHHPAALDARDMASRQRRSGGAGFAAFAFQGWLIDIATPWLSSSLLFLLLLAATLAEADQQRRLYNRDLEIQRKKEAKFASELEAARRIQMGILPDASKIRDPAGRIDVVAFLEPAREVGGDPYDLFLIDDGKRLFFMIGDVAGKGIPASLFMALGKSLYKRPCSALLTIAHR